MKAHIKSFALLTALILLFMSLSSCANDSGNAYEESTGRTGSESDIEFTPEKGMIKLVAVTDKYSFDPKDERPLKLFNQRLKEMGKKYYLDFKIIDNTPKDEKEKDNPLTSYSLKYQDGVMKMKRSGDSADIITMGIIDDSAEHRDYDAFYLNGAISPLSEYLSDGRYKSLGSLFAERNGDIYIIPSSLTGIGRGWETETSALKANGIKAEDLQAELWDILKSDKFKGKKIYADPSAEDYMSGSGEPLPPYNAECYYDLLSPCVGVKLNDENPTAINIYEDEFMQSSISASYEMASQEDSDLSLYACATTDCEITETADSTYIPIDEKIYIKGAPKGLGIASWSKNKEYAFDLIALLNTDKELSTLLNYGIEGENYKLNSDSSVAVSDAQSEQYRNIYYPFGNDKVLPKNTAAVSNEAENAVFSPICGFIFDRKNIKTEIDNTNKVIEKYRSSLFVGKGEQEGLYKKFLNDLENAGINRIIDEANKQILDWKNKMSDMS